MNQIRSYFVRSTRCLTAGVILLLASPSAFAAFGDELFKLTASDAAAADNFGVSVAVSGNTAIVGTSRYESPPTTAGSAYLFDVTTGQELYKLTGSDALVGGFLGIAVDISGNRAIVGSYTAAAYLFDTTTGQEIAKLTTPDAPGGGGFAVSVAISGNIALIGATGDDDNGMNSGAAYLIDLTGSNDPIKLTATDAAAGDNFGYSVDLSGDTAIIGAYSSPSSGDPHGAAYLFDVATGQQLFKLEPDNPNDSGSFGRNVAISGNTALVGAYHDDEKGFGAGAAYVFDVATGLKRFKLTTSDAAAGDYFGTSVAISGNTAFVGAPIDNNHSGSAYLFNVTTGREIAKLTASDATAHSDFGYGVAISGNRAVVGSPADSDEGNGAGSAYLFRVPEPNSLLLAILASVGFIANRQSVV